MKLKQNFYVINHFKIKAIIIFTIVISIIIITVIYIKYQSKQFTVEVSTINTRQIEQIKSEETDSVGEEEIENLRETINLKEYENMPKKIGEYKIIGKIEIPKIKVEKYILEITNEESLRKSVTKICGPKINRTGNFCIAGHNYKNTFGRLNQLENGDVIKLTDTYDRTISYKIYDIQKVNPKDISCLSQETEGEREVTLVTCTLGAIKRIIVKAIEIYD